MGKFIVEYYEKQDGSCPTEEFMDSLDSKMRAKLLRLQLLLEENGNEIKLAKKYRRDYLEREGRKNE